MPIDLTKFESALDNCKNKKIAVVGDVMLDRYFWGKVSRISPEAPVPVVDVERESARLGGAANVAKNLLSFGINPLLCGAIGDDSAGSAFLKIAYSKGISGDGLCVDSDRPTTVKTRIIGNNQQIVRLDQEVRSPIKESVSDKIYESVVSAGPVAGIVFEDYDKGTLSPVLINRIISFAKKNGIPVFVDPKYDNFFEYKRSTVFKPNRREASAALGIEINSIEDARSAGEILIKKLDCEHVLITLGADGIALYDKSGSFSQAPTTARRVADVSGAGDTTIASLAACVAGGLEVREAACAANAAAGLVCEKPGIVAVDIEELKESIRRNNFPC